MPDEIIDDPDQRDDAGLTPAERRQLEKRATDSERKLAIFEAGLGDLNETQRNALLGAAGSDLTTDNLKAKAEELFGAPKSEEAPPPPPPEQVQTLAAEQQIANAASGSQPPPPPTGKLADLHKKVTTMPVGALMRMDPSEAIAAIQEAGLTLGNVEHSGEFHPLSALNS